MPTPSFTGELIDGPSAANWLLTRLCLPSPGTSICSAFLRSEAVRMLFSTDVLTHRGRMLTRWKLSDLLSGSSDLDAYPLAKSLGFSFYVRQDFHGKVFSIPDNGIIVGSANATLSGLGLKEDFNSELCTLVPYSDVNQKLIEQIFEGSVEVTDLLFDEISTTLTKFVKVKNEANEWPKVLLDKLQPFDFRGRILLSECFVSVPLIGEHGEILELDEYDVQLLGLVGGRDLNKNVLRTAFKGTRPYRWLLHTLKSFDGEAYFGSLTQAFHSTLLGNPKVYRRDVKTILQVLVSWCVLLGVEEVIVDRPNYSQRIRLV